MRHATIMKNKITKKAKNTIVFCILFIRQFDVELVCVINEIAMHGPWRHEVTRRFGKMYHKEKKNAFCHSPISNRLYVWISESINLQYYCVCRLSQLFRTT